ncbi:hypothetical protein ABU162_20020 [Paenibacillus thiaminolyticus]|uniref:hypothetical protein n=1 Tax=Paenibacillus thiaminolyticus TaxID=49283 RepID=UPI0035A6439E
MVRHMIFAQGRHDDELNYGMLKSEDERMKGAASAARPCADHGPGWNRSGLAGE